MGTALVKGGWGKDGRGSLKGKGKTRAGITKRGIYKF